MSKLVTLRLVHGICGEAPAVRGDSGDTSGATNHMYFEAAHSHLGGLEDARLSPNLVHGSGEQSG